MKTKRLIAVTRHVWVFKRHCLRCGKTFEGSKLAKYCSDRCRKLADYARHAEERRQNRRERYKKTKKGGK